VCLCFGVGWKEGWASGRSEGAKGSGRLFLAGGKWRSPVRSNYPLAKQQASNGASLSPSDAPSFSPSCSGRRCQLTEPSATLVQVAVALASGCRSGDAEGGAEGAAEYELAREAGKSRRDDQGGELEDNGPRERWAARDGRIGRSRFPQEPIDRCAVDRQIDEHPMPCYADDSTSSPPRLTG
jgi:hypothetical protein